MANGDEFIAQGILQAGQAIGQGIQQRGQRRQQQLLLQQQQLKQKFENLRKQQDVLLKVVGSKDFSDDVRASAGKEFLQNNQVLNPGSGLPSGFDEFDAPTQNFFKNLTTLDKLKSSGIISPEMEKKAMQVIIQSAQSQASKASESQREALRNAVTFEQEQRFGPKGAPIQEFQTPTGQQITGRATPGGGVSPIQSDLQLAPKAQPAETAGRAASAQLGLQNIDDALNILFPEGESDPIARVTASFPAVFPRSAGKRASELLDAAIEAKLRADTGATARQEEIDALKKQFGINVLKDKPQQTFDKLMRLRFVLQNSLFRMDPQGKIKTVPLNKQNLQQSGKIKVKSFRKIGD